MHNLHAPWRIRYILGPKSVSGDGSVFSAIANSSDDLKNLVISRRKHVFTVLNRYPYNGGHLLIVPYREIAELEELTPDEMLELMQELACMKQLLSRVMKPDGFNVGLNQGKVAGAGIAEHLHFHLVPRWNGDTNFMPVLAATTVLPEALEDLALRLRTTLATL